ncbi:hypothetical protein HAX54_018434 [Datura stramonium]|uniref:Uncharacterized protein n=1 Tax=Datura stramonium TaxID=4076 RepID=A0ABS8UME1_DATST|nr:hypothetical protein [Datura stramonium]
MNGVTEEQLKQLNMDYPLSEYSSALCRIGPGFKKLLNDDVAIDEDMASIANSMGSINLPLEEMIEEKRVEAARLAEEAQLAKVARRADTVANKGLKWLKKGTKGSSSSAKGTLARRFRAKVVEPHGLTWFNRQKVAKYAPKNWIDEGRLALESLGIRDKVREVGIEIYICRV